MTLHRRFPMKGLPVRRTGGLLVLALVALAAGCKKSQIPLIGRGFFPEAKEGEMAVAEAEETPPVEGAWKSTGPDGEPVWIYPGTPEDAARKAEEAAAEEARRASASATGMIPGNPLLDGPQTFGPDSIPEGPGGEFAPESRTIPELPPILFEFDQFALTDQAKAGLPVHATFLAQNPELRVVLRGHTDDSGTEEYNLSLGSRRALAVRDWLIREGGIAAERLTTVSFGELLPASDLQTTQARAQNRRVEFFVYEFSEE